MLFDVSSKLCEFIVFEFFGDWSLPLQDWLLPQEAKCVFHFCICISFMSLCLYLHLLEAGLCPPKIGFSRKRQKGPKKLRADPFTRKNFNDWIHSFARSFSMATVLAQLARSINLIRGSTSTIFICILLIFIFIVVFLDLISRNANRLVWE